MSAFNFDANEVKPNSGGGPVVVVPRSEQTGSILSSEIKANSKKDGKVLELNIKISGGDYNNVVVKDWINIANPSVQCQEIGLGTLSQICHCVGVLKIQSTEQLHGRPFKFTVDVEPFEHTDRTTGVKTMKERNTVTGYSKIEGSAPAGQASAPPAFLTQAAPPVQPVSPPVQPTAPPVAPAIPTPPPVSDKLYFFSHKGSAPEAVPVPLAQVFAKGLPVEEVMIVENGQSTWQPLASLVAAPSAPASTPPPWAKQ